MAQNKDNLNQTPAEDILDQLAFLANEELKLNDDVFLKQNRKRKKKDKAGRKDADTNRDEAMNTAGQDSKQSGKDKYDDSNGPVIEEIPGAAQEEAENNPFTLFMKQMDEAQKKYFGDAYQAAEEVPDKAAAEPEEPSTEAEPSRKKKKKKSRRSKASGQAQEVHLIGEEITREKAEEILTGRASGKGGHRATIIIHRTVVDTDGNQIEVTSEPEKTEEPVREQPAAENTGADILQQKAVEEAAPQPEDPPEETILYLVRAETREMFPIDQDLSIGRGDDNDIVIPEPDGHYVSGHHADISLQGRDVFLKDAGSTNGTFVNDRKVGSKRLKAGMKVRFADIDFVIEEGTR